MLHLTTIEFDTFVEHLRGSFVSSFARGALSRVAPSTDADAVGIRQSEYGEALRVLGVLEVTITNDEEFFELLPRLFDPIGTFTPGDFMILKRFIRAAGAVKKAVLGVDSVNTLRPFLSGIHVLTDLVDRIEDTIDDYGDIKDSASGELRTIRRGLTRTRKSVNDQLMKIINSGNADKFVQDKVITERNGRFTIPCRTNFHQYIQGIVHDRSATGQTLYVEPASAVETNNEWQTLRISEGEEIARIIRELIATVNEHRPEIESTAEHYGELALRIETAKFFKPHTHCFPEIDDEVAFSAVHHPLIYLAKQNDSVPIDIKLPGSGSIAVITGPNTGGKTAAIKSLGLNHAIAACGMPIFGKHASIRLFTDILADIGDQQSLVMDLSTFSAHMMNIKSILEHAGSHSLVLLDELGTGTEPREGAALAVAVLKHLADAGAAIAVTTHFADVKHFAAMDERCSLYAVDFDYKTLAPKYRLLENVAGKSDPIIIAGRLGFPEHIVDDARSIATERTTEAELALEEINDLRADMARRMKELGVKEDDMKKRLSEITRREQRMAERLRAKEQELLAESYGLLQKAKRMAEGKEKVTDTDAVKNDIARAGKRLDTLKSKQKSVRGLEPGDIVHLEKYGKNAKVLEIDGSRVHLDMEGLKVSMDRRDVVGKKLTDEDRVGQEKVVQVSPNVSRGQRQELVIVGKRVEEGIDMVEKFIDESMLGGFERVFIVHGRGSGQLRKAVHEYLRRNAAVKSFRIATNEEGGNAVTVAEF